MWLLKIRNALIVMGVFLAVIWLLQVFNWADGYRLDQAYGIHPEHVSSLPDIFTAPFLHASWAHIEGNSIPLFMLGVLAAYRSLVRFAFATLIIAVTSGMAVWFFQSSSSVTIGASGLIFGYFGYVVVRGFFDRNLIDIAVGLAAGVLQWTILTLALPGTPGVSWLAHLGGLIGGVLAAWLLRNQAQLTWRQERTATPVSPAPAAPGTTALPAGSSAPTARPASRRGKSVDDMLHDLKRELNQDGF